MVHHWWTAHSGGPQPLMCSQELRTVSPRILPLPRPSPPEGTMLSWAHIPQAARSPLSLTHCLAPLPGGDPLSPPLSLTHCLHCLQFSPSHGLLLPPPPSTDFAPTPLSERSWGTTDFASFWITLVGAEGGGGGRGGEGGGRQASKTAPHVRHVTIITPCTAPCAPGDQHPHVSAGREPGGPRHVLGPGQGGGGKVQRGQRERVGILSSHHPWVQSRGAWMCTERSAACSRPALVLSPTEHLNRPPILM